MLFLGEPAPPEGTFFFDDEQPSKLRILTELSGATRSATAWDQTSSPPYKRLGLIVNSICLEPSTILIRWPSAGMPSV